MINTIKQLSERKTSYYFLPKSNNYIFLNDFFYVYLKSVYCNKIIINIHPLMFLSHFFKLGACNVKR